jgi:hypothetical protein
MTGTGTRIGGRCEAIALAAMAVWAAAGLAIAIGCTPRPSPTDDGPPPDVTLEDIAPPEPIAPPADATAEPGSGLVYRVQRVDLPLHRPMNQAWSLIDESIASPIQRAVWANNGLRLGTIGAGDAGDLAEAVGAPIDLRQSTRYNLGEATSIRSGSRLTRPVPVDLTIPPMNIRQVWAERGRFRLLMREVAAGAGGAEVELMLQLYRPQARLIPRTADEIGDRLLDGEVYDPLTARVALAPSQLLVVGLHWPWQPPPEPIPNFMADRDAAPREPADPNGAPPPSPEPDTPDASDTPDTSDPTQEPTEASPPGDASTGNAGSDSGAGSGSTGPAPPPLEAPPLPPSIGRSLLAGQRFGQSVQVMLLISVDDGSIRVESARP